MNKFRKELFRINQISGILYTVENKPKKRVVIYGIGAPVPPDSGNLPDAPFILDFEVDLFVPDYLGYGRSDGKFTPMNCIRTFLKLFDAFQKGSWAINHYEKKKVFLKYKEIFFIGRSFGGMYISWLPKFNSKIKNLGLICPILDYVECGKLPGEETIKKFYKAINEDGYKFLYRGINSKVWKNHFQNRDGLCPMKNIFHLEQANVFIGHGEKDTNIYFKHSVEYYKNLARTFPAKLSHFKLKLYPNGDHGFGTSNKAVRDYLKWLNVPKRKPLNINL